MIYWDNAATTNVTQEVLDAMLPYLSPESNKYGNPSSKHALGMSNRMELNTLRNSVASSLGCKESEVYFTSGGSEANNMAIKGIAMSHLNDNKKDILISAIEHHSILNQIPQLTQLGFNVITIPVNSAGVVDIDFIKDNISNKTLLVSVMTVNNETGAIQPIEAISDICKRHNTLLHSDAVQALSHTDIPIGSVDLMSFSGHKIHAPKGIGCLVIKDNVEFSPLICGGGQERGKRGGTENIAMIAGFAKALSLYGSRDDEAEIYQRQISDRIVDFLLSNGVDLIINSKDANRVSNILNISIKGVDGETVQLLSSMKDLYISTHSACDSYSQTPSHVLEAIGVSKEYIQGSLRLSFSNLDRYDESKLSEVLEVLLNVITANRLVKE